MRGAGHGRPIRSRVFACVLFASAIGCANRTGEMPGLAAEPGRRAGSEDRSVLRAADIAREGSTLDVLVELRPEFLRPRPGSNGMAEPVLPAVYLDGAMLPDLAMLRQIPIAWVREIRYIGASKAWARFGRMHEGGVIFVISKTAPDAVAR